MHFYNAQVIRQCSSQALLDGSSRKFIHKNIVINNKEREVTSLTQEELRAALLKRLEREKQCWISKAAGINKDTLSRFKRGKIDLYPHLFVKLETYLKNIEQ